MVSYMVLRIVASLLDLSFQLSIATVAMSSHMLYALIQFVMGETAPGTDMLRCLMVCGVVLPAVYFTAMMNPCWLAMIACGFVVCLLESLATRWRFIHELEMAPWMQQNQRRVQHRALHPEDL